MSISIKDNLMKSQIKGLRLVVMSVLAVLAMVNVQYAQADEFNQGVLRYRTLTENTVEVIAPTSGEYTGDITVPSVVTHNATRYHVTAIGDYAFQGAKQVTSVTLPLTSITTIGGWAFNDCTGLTSFTLPESITKIGEKAFYFCDKLQHLYVHSSQPNSYNPGKEAFLYINRPNNVCTLHVPTGCTKAYAADAAFKVFTQVEEFNPPVLFDLYVAGEQVTELNKADILGDGAANYNAENNVLTISGDITASGSSNDGTGIYSEIADLTIQVSAPATITASQVGMCFTQSATITGSSLLTIKSNMDFDYSIFVDNADITINKANLDLVGELYCSTHGTLTILSSSVSVDSPHYYNAIKGWDSLVLTGCYIEIPEQGEYNTSHRRVEDKNGNIAGKVNIISGSGPIYYDLYIAGTKVSNFNSSDILGDGAASYDASTKTLTLNGDITASGSKYSGVGIYSNISDITIHVSKPATITAEIVGMSFTQSATITGSSLLTIKSECDISIQADHANICINAANLNLRGKLYCSSQGTLTIQSSTVTVNSPTIYRNAIDGWKSLVLTGCYIEIPEQGEYNTLQGRVEDKNGNIADNVNIIPGIGPVYYDLYIAGTKVSSFNSSDILGDGAASYNAEKNMLTISGNITALDANAPCIFSSLDNLTIQVNAPATLSANGGGAGIYVEKGNATITGSSKLTIISKPSGDYSATAISLQKANLTISDANISTTGAIFCDGDLKIINSQIETNDRLLGSGSFLTIENSSVSSSTIIHWKSLTLTDCYIKTPQGGYYDTSAKELKDASSYTAKIVEICPMGDANDNDIVDVADIVEMVNAKNGNPSNKFVLKNADLDGDGKITQADIDKAVELILHKNAK